MKYSLSSDTGDTFAVPRAVADKHLRLASGEQLKVLLFILSKSPAAVGKDEISKGLRYDPADVEDCLQYWILTGVLRETEGDAPKQQPVRFVPKNNNAEPVKEPTASNVTEIEYSRPDAAEIAVRIEEDKKIANLFFELQLKLGKTIGYDGQCTFLLLHDRFGLPVEVIFMLVDYCVGIRKKGYSYIEKVGRNWSELEIDTIEKAAEKISSLKSADSFWSEFVQYTGIKSPKPTALQSEYIEKWTKYFDKPDDLIFRAYDIMSENTGKLSFSYMDKILTNWHNAGCKTVKDTEKADAEKASKKPAAAVAEGNNASYDLNAYFNKPLTGLKYERKDK